MEPSIYIWRSGQSLWPWNSQKNDIVIYITMIYIDLALQKIENTIV